MFNLPFSHNVKADPWPGSSAGGAGAYCFKIRDHRSGVAPGPPVGLYFLGQMRLEVKMLCLALAGACEIVLPEDREEEH